MAASKAAALARRADADAAKSLQMEIPSLEVVAVEQPSLAVVEVTVETSAVKLEVASETAHMVDEAVAEVAVEAAEVKMEVASEAAQGALAAAAEVSNSWGGESMDLRVFSAGERCLYWSGTRLQVGASFQRARSLHHFEVTFGYCTTAHFPLSNFALSTFHLFLDARLGVWCLVLDAWC